MAKLKNATAVKKELDKNIGFKKAYKLELPDQESEVLVLRELIKKLHHRVGILESKLGVK